MSLALDFLKDYLARPERTQAEFALAAGMTATNVGDLLKGDVLISGRNLNKLLRGFRTEEDRVAFLGAHLRDQIPSDYADTVSVVVRPDGSVCEAGEGTDLDTDMLRAFQELPSQLHKKRAVRFLQHLRRDASLRDLFVRTVAYLEEADTGSVLALGDDDSSPGAAVEEVARQVEEARRSPPAVAPKRGASGGTRRAARGRAPAEEQA